MSQSTGAENIKWDVSELFASATDPKIDSTIDTAKSEVQTFVDTYKTKLNTLSDTDLNTAFETLETILAPLYKLSQYSHLIYSVDVTDTNATKLVARVEDVYSDIANQIVFFDLELGKLDSNILASFKTTEALKNYHYQIEKTEKQAKYTLTEKEEQLINLKSVTGRSAFQKLYTDVTSEFSFEFEVDGETRKMNGSELRSLRQHPDPDVRRRAMQTFYARYEEHKTVLTQCYNNVVKDFNADRKLRGYASAISVKNVGNDLDDNVIETLHAITNESYPLVERYYTLKAKLVGLKDMTLADIYAPLPESTKFYNWDDSKKLVLDSYASFDGEFADKAKAMFDENRIHAPTGATKQGGAYCSGYTPDTKPYVMLNHTGKLRDVSTMAHELGHAVHDMYCNKQTLFNFHPILPLAETASVFGEMILTDYMLNHETDKQAKISIITSKLEDIFASSHRQNMFSNFEMSAHSAISEQFMTSEELCELYDQKLHQMFGGSVTYTPEYKWEWSSIPHIYQVPFYVYAYNFGNLLVIALYQQYLEEGASFIPKYKEFLSMGSVATPTAITKTVNADITDPEFWRKSIRYIENQIDQLEALVS